MTDRSCLAIVLAAGEGTRMRSSIPKVLHAIGNRTLVAHVLTTAVQAGGGEIAVVIAPHHQAIAEEVKRVAPQAQILHFAAHAVADQASPLESYITLASRQRAGAENGYLQAWEVMMQMRLRAHLVVLSACDTAGGREAAGEGMLGLTHAFHYAGAPQVMASLWPVSDQATAQLMRSFYQRISLGESSDAALRTAQLEMLHGEERSWFNRLFSPEVVEPRRAWQHPYYWAGFQLSGADEGR